MLDGQIDYSTYAMRDLREAQQSIDRAKFPINAARLDEETRSRGVLSVAPVQTVERPRSIPVAAPGPLRARRAIWLFVVYFLVQLGVSFLGGIVATIFAVRAVGIEGEIRTYVSEFAIFPISIISVLAGGAVVFAMVRRSLPGKIRDGAFAPIGWTATPLFHAALAAFVGATIAWYVTHSAIPIALPTPEQEFGPLTTAVEAAGAVEGIRWGLLFWGMLLIVAAPVEEFLFRGAMLAGFAQSFGMVIAGVLVTVIFVAMHLFETRLYIPAILAISALAVGALIARLTTGSLIAPISLHAAYNLVIVVEGFS